MVFRRKLLVLTVSAMSFAGLAYGDACSAPGTTPTQPSLTPNLLRLEGTAELLADNIISCSGDSLAATTGQVIAQLSLPVTSKQTSSAPVASEATLVINVGGTLNNANGIITGGTSVAYPGTVSGSQVTFGTTSSPVTFPTTPYFIRFANIRVNASSGAIATYVAESVLATNQGVVIYATTPVNVGYIQQGFSVSAPTGVQNYVICTGNPAKSVTVNPATGLALPSFNVKVSELFGGAFKTQTGAGTCGGAPCSVTNGEQGSYQGTGGIGTANTGTLFVFSFANITSGEVINMPTTVTNGTLNFTLVTSLTNTTPVTASVPTGSNLPALSAPLTSANGAATAVYNVMATDNTQLGENVTISGFVTANAGFATSQVSAITLTVAPGGTGSLNPTLIVPNFATQSPTPQGVSAFGVCQTSLLFPFVTAAQGFDTGIALANTSTDPFGTTGTPGTCALNLYGTGAPTTNTGIPAPGGSIASGTVATFQIGGSGTAPGFQGYMIVVCNFQYAHGYAFILAGSGTTAVAQGYLALTFTGATTVRNSPPTPEALNN